MFNDQFHISKLIAGHLHGTLDDQQLAELTEWIRSSKENSTYLEEVFYKEGQVRELLKEFNSIDETAIWQKTLIRLQDTDQKKIPVLWPLRKWLRIAAAAIILIAGAGLFFINRQQNADQPVQRYANDISPGKYNATLTLADGKQIILTDAVRGELAKESGIVISKAADGQVVYENRGKQGGQNTEMNTLSTEKGQTFQVLLPDGSRVWLNAASSLRYPASFAALKYRQVELLKGEAYFEVAKDKMHPFIVKSSQQRVEVLGTHFNINAYTDDANVKTTLLEGVVRISSQFPHLQMPVGSHSAYQPYNSLLLKPGQQAQISLAGIALVKEADLEDVIAWKEGYFNFNENIESIMSKVARWYNVDVIYENAPDAGLKLKGKISRTKNLSEILNMLEYTGGLRFKIEGRRVIVRK